jgi:glycosyltransferase involved in cell wall biosynthesis
MPILENDGTAVSQDTHAPAPTPMGTRRISVVIPARNEARNLPHVLNLIPDHVYEVILVDGDSVDDTISVASRTRPDVIVVKQPRQGKGNALAAGFAACRGEYIVMLDADGSMDPLELNRFISALDDGADYVKGSRFMAGGGSADITAVRRWGNHALMILTNAMFGTRYSDLCYGYNAFRRDCLPAFELPDHMDLTTPARWGDGFEIETLMNTRIARSGLVVQEVPSFERSRLYGRSNLRTFRDGFRALVTLFRERFSPLTHPSPAPIDLVPRAADGGEATL